MKLAKLRLADGSLRVGIVENDHVQLLDLLQLDNCRSLSDILHSRDPRGLAQYLVDRHAPALSLSSITLLAPIDRQEVWAAGVTYKRSQIARMEESESGASHYDKVYTAPRPEIFFKATPARVAGPGEPLRVRADSSWSVPEPELALVISPELKLIGFTVGNDMSARDIEGENPLYLPQAKVYNQCCGLGPCVLVPESPLNLDQTAVDLLIERNGETAFAAQTKLSQLNRTFEELIGWLGRENDLPTGAFLLTGTGIVPPDQFSLEQGDVVHIEITGIGRLTNPIVKNA